MVQYIDNLNIASTSTLYYTGAGAWDYNRSFVVDNNADDTYTKISMLNDKYSVKYFKNDEQATYANNAVIIQGMVVSVGYRKQFNQNPISKQNCIYAAPRLENGEYVEQNPFSTITYEIDPARFNYARPIIDGAVYNPTWTKIGNSEYDAYIYLTPAISANGIEHIYDADRLAGLATYQYSEYPTFAQNLRNMSHGAARVIFASLFYNNTPSYHGINLFSGITFLDDLWLMPFASDDEYNAAFALLYKWPNYAIQEIENWSRT